MNVKLAACLLALALLIGWVLFQVGGGREGVARGAGAAVPAESPVPEVSPVAEEVPAPESAPSAVAREEAAPLLDPGTRGSWRGELAGLSGRVVESDGTPVAGVRVALLEVDSIELFDGGAIDEEEPSLELEETVTDGEGRFLLGGARAPAFHGLGVDLGGPRATIRMIDHALPHRERTDIGDVVLAPYGVLKGRVVDESGAPVPGARVRFGPFPEEILRGSPQEFRSDSLIAVSLLNMGGEGQGIIELPAWIRALIDRLPVPTTQSAADGTFRLEGVALAKVVGGIDKRGYVGVPMGPIDVSGDVSGGEKDLGDVVLKRGRTIRGVVEDPYGEPVPGVEVHAGAEIVPGIVAILQPCGQSDAEGRFELTGVAETGQVVAAARRAKHESWSTTVTERHDSVVIELQETLQLTVNVHDGEGKPLSGARIQLTPARRPGGGMDFGEILMVLPRPTSPAETFHEVEAGRYVTANLGAGLYDVTARVAGLAPACVQVDCRANTEVTLTCATGSLIELRVIDSVTKAPVMGARGSVLHVGGSGFTKLVVASTDAEGRARLGPLPQSAAEHDESGLMPVETMVLVQHPRYADHSAALDPSVSPLVVALQSGGTVAGRVHCGGALPTRIYMLSLEYRGADGFLEAFHLPRFSVTDLGGEFRLTNLTPGKYGVELSERFLNQDPLGLMGKDDFSVPSLHREEIEVRNGETTELVIDLGPSGRGPSARVVGRVRLDGHNLEGAEVRVRGNESVRVVTDAAGRFETAPFSIGDSTWISIEGDVRLADGRTRRTPLYDQSVELHEDEVHEIDLDLYPLTIRVQVVDASGQPVPEAQVSASAKFQESDDGSSTSTNSSGEAELLILKPGEYELTANAAGFGGASSPVNVRAEGMTETTLIRLPRSVACAGRVQVDAPAVVENRRGFAYLRAQGVDNGCSAGVMLEPPEYGFTLEGLAAGKYRTWIYIAGQQGKEGSFELGPDGAKDLVLTFVPSED